MKKSERKKGFPGLRRAGSLAGRGPMPAAPGSFLVGPSFLGVVETTKEIITYVLASCKHEFQQPKRWTKSGSQKSSNQSTKFLIIPGFTLDFDFSGTPETRKIHVMFSATFLECVGVLLPRKTRCSLLGICAVLASTFWGQKIWSNNTTRLPLNGTVFQPRNLVL